MASYTISLYFQPKFCSSIWYTCTVIHIFQTLAATFMDDQELTESMQKLLIVMQRLDEKIGPVLESDGELFNKRWGWLSRAGLWDKSHLTRQIEKYADIYTSRVSNFLHYTPFMYFQSQEQTLAHDAHSYFREESIKAQWASIQANVERRRRENEMILSMAMAARLQQLSIWIDEWWPRKSCITVCMYK